MRLLHLVLATCVLACGSLAHAQQAKTAPCTAPEHRQFDFWLGEWEVRDATGAFAGRNEITSVHNGCVVFESWRGRGGVTGMSFNIYDAEHKKWRQTWVDSTGGFLELEGTFADGKMELASPAGDGKGSVNRITWQRLPDARVRQLWETSTDGGATWKVAFDGYYEKKR